MRGFVDKALTLLTREALSERTLRESDAKISALVGTAPLLNVRDRAALSWALGDILRKARIMSEPKWYLASKPVFDRVYAACYKAERRSVGREIGKQIETALQVNRMSLPKPTILYLCTSHQNPREEHRALQGQLYVDRYWRATLSGTGHSDDIPDLEPLVADLMTVQEAIAGPHWLMTSPDCHHALLPIPYGELLDARSADGVAARHPEAWKGNPRQKKTDSERRRYREGLRLKTIGRIKAIPG